MVSLMYNWPWLLYFKYYGQHCPNNSNQFQTVSWSNSNTNLDLHVAMTDHFCIFMHCIGLHKGGAHRRSVSFSGGWLLSAGGSWWPLTSHTEDRTSPETSISFPFSGSHCFFSDASMSMTVKRGCLPSMSTLNLLWTSRYLVEEKGTLERSCE